VTLQGLDTANNNRVVTYGTRTSPVFTLAGTSSVAACGGDVLAVVGVGRVQTTVSDKRLAIVFVGKSPKYLTPPTLAYLSPSSSGDGFTVAAVHYPNRGEPSGPAALTAVTVKDGSTSQSAPSADCSTRAHSGARPGTCSTAALRPGAERREHTTRVVFTFAVP
jgi:hypothetical protein